MFMLRMGFCLFVAFSLGSCASQKITKQLPLKSGYYVVKTPRLEPVKSYLHVSDDSVTAYTVQSDGSFGLPGQLLNNSLVLDRSFDVDAMTMAFKFRPSVSNFPRQLTTEFNGNVFMGYRVDRYRTHLVKTPHGVERDMKHKAFTAGIFGGIGTTFVSPWTTDYRIANNDEYQGFILSHGVSTMVGIDNLTVGLAVGWDYLTDRDKSIWIYQNKIWFGLALSLNIN